MGTPVDDTKERLVRVETKLDLLLTEVGTRHADYEKRLRVLETQSTEQRTKMRIWLAVVGAAATAGGTALGTIASHLTGA